MEQVAFEQLDPATLASIAALRGADPLARAIAEVEEARRETLDRARAEGHAAGLAAAAAAVEAATAALADAVAGVDAAVGDFCIVAERRAVELALFLAERIVGDALSVKPELVLEAVAGSLRAASERDHLVVEVNPEDLALVQESLADISSRVGGIHQLEVVPERRVPRGGSIVRTVQGEIDARVSEKLDLARAAILEALAAGA